jgi:hypothetical protein
VSASELFAELEAAGVRLTRAGDNLRFQTRFGISIAPFQDRIREGKPVLLRDLLQREIVDAVDVEREQFNRAEYEQLWARLIALDAGEDR